MQIDCHEYVYSNRLPEITIDNFFMVSFRQFFHDLICSYNTFDNLSEAK
jgi:hypothetical protein